MSLLDQYHQDVQSGKIQFDKAQADVLEKLDVLLNTLSKSEPSFLGFQRFKPVKGMYLYGSVGVGKTYLMDIFYNHLFSVTKLRKKSPPVYRTHFHRFLQYIYAELTFYQGKPNPLTQIAKTIAKNHRVLCFDELYVSDIGDAMLLGNLFNALFKEGITLIATSNSHPDELYKNGLQRDLFLPAIAALKTHTNIVLLESAMDYRLRMLTQAGVYFYPLDQEARHAMYETFMSFADTRTMQNTPLLIWGREIETRCYTNDLAWFNCEILCSPPRSAQDYLELARRFQSIFISDIPIFKANMEQEDMARNFINMIDIFYDHQVKLILSAEGPIMDLYQGEKLKFDFARTRSRLIEMQSKEYLAREHRP